MAVRIGSARIDENGRATGGKAGDQTGKELSTQNWYRHSKGWRVFRARSAAAREMIACCMEAACANRNIGYDQGQRLTLYKVAAAVGYDCGRVTTACETDCSALVRVCMAYAGIPCGNFRTTTQPAMMLATGAFVELEGDKYTCRDDYLMRGDVLVTKTQGHTVIVLTNGGKAGEAVVIAPAVLGERILRNGCEGDDVKQLQTYLIQLGFFCGKNGADGDYSDNTELAVIDAQRMLGVDQDGEYGPITHRALMARLDAVRESATGGVVEISGGRCWVRGAPSTDGAKLGVVTSGKLMPYGGQTSETGWLLVEYDNRNGWVSGKYGRIV